MAGLGSGVTEAVLVVTPAEVCKIRLQAQFHSMADPVQLANRKYKNVLQTAFLIVKEEGLGALYKGRWRAGCSWSRGLEWLVTTKIASCHCRCATNGAASRLQPSGQLHLL